MGTNQPQSKAPSAPRPVGMQSMSADLYLEIRRAVVELGGDYRAARSSELRRPASHA